MACTGLTTATLGATEGLLDQFPYSTSSSAAHSSVQINLNPSKAIFENSASNEASTICRMAQESAAVTNATTACRMILDSSSKCLAHGNFAPTSVTFVPHVKFSGTDLEARVYEEEVYHSDSEDDVFTKDTSNGISSMTINDVCKIQHANIPGSISSTPTSKYLVSQEMHSSNNSESRLQVPYSDHFSFPPKLSQLQISTQSKAADLPPRLAVCELPHLISAPRASTQMSTCLSQVTFLQPSYLESSYNAPLSSSQCAGSLTNSICLPPVVLSNVSGTLSSRDPIVTKLDETSARRVFEEIKSTHSPPSLSLFPRSTTAKLRSQAHMRSHESSELVSSLGQEGLQHYTETEFGNDALIQNTSQAKLRIQRSPEVSNNRSQDGPPAKIRAQVKPYELCDEFVPPMKLATLEAPKFSTVLGQNVSQVKVRILEPSEASQSVGLHKFEAQLWCQDPEEQRIKFLETASSARKSGQVTSVGVGPAEHSPPVPRELRVISGAQVCSEASKLQPSQFSCEHRDGVNQAQPVSSESKNQNKPLPNNSPQTHNMSLDLFCNTGCQNVSQIKKLTPGAAEEICDVMNKSVSQPIVSQNVPVTKEGGHESYTLNQDKLQDRISAHAASVTCNTLIQSYKLFRDENIRSLAPRVGLGRGGLRSDYFDVPISTSPSSSSLSNFEPITISSSATSNSSMAVVSETAVCTQRLTQPALTCSTFLTAGTRPKECLTPSFRFPDASKLLSTKVDCVADLCTFELSEEEQESKVKSDANNNNYMECSSDETWHTVENKKGHYSFRPVYFNDQNKRRGSTDVKHS